MDRLLEQLFFVVPYILRHGWRQVRRISGRVWACVRGHAAKLRPRPGRPRRPVVRRECPPLLRRLWDTVVEALVILAATAVMVGIWYCCFVIYPDWTRG